MVYLDTICNKAFDYTQSDSCPALHMIHTVQLKLVTIGNVDRHNVCFYAEMSTLRLTVCVMMQNGRYFATVTGEDIFMETCSLLW